MKKSRVIIALVVVFAVLALLMLFKSKQSGEEPDAIRPEQTQEKDKAVKPTTDKAGSVELEQQQRREKMQEAYAKLEQDRKQLRSTANLLKSLSWGLELPKGEARRVNDAMRQAYAYLKNPAQLGAYYQVADIELESRKIEAMVSELNGVEAVLKALRESR